ncbi:hypothetical protein [Actinokineospora iranica]|uniref:HEAT repeat-containing protein n=1 Tax=Actinokineospora iranica TaxID=1271860 RepID=A0A1G6WAF5_9PSEU|nr:hypothetical protein [Actinokineospora iranica]SDD62852.1 hypothetical protein SAMN05216174_11492 [Actinokineospora iranica]
MTTAILDHIVAHLDPSGCGLLPGGDELPDEVRRDGRVRWASGARDGAQGRHAGGGDAAGVLPELVTAAATGAAADYDRLYAALCMTEVLAGLDDVLRGLRAAPVDGVRALGVRLVTEGRHREPVKFGIGLLGLGAGAAERDLLLRIGRHEEFTMFSAAAILTSHPDPEPVLLDLARGVQGWGRICVVERFGMDAGPRVRDWLLRGGFRNSVMDEYLAHKAATVGRLADALADDGIDDELLAGACDIICALIDGGPAEGIDDYADAPLAVRLLLGHLERRAHSLRHFVITARVEEFLSGPGWERRYRTGWDLARHEVMVRRCRDLMAEPHWRELAERGLTAPDDRTFHDARYAARVLGVDPFPATLARARATADGAEWFSLMADATEDRLPDILTLARDVLPLADLATGPEPAYTILDTIVTRLRDFPGHGVELVLAALRCPVARNRIMAVKTLTGWGPESWRPEVQTALRQAVAEEPDPGLRESMAQLLTHGLSEPRREPDHG